MAEEFTGYFSASAQTGSLVGPIEATRKELEKRLSEMKDKDLFVVELPLFQGQTEEALPLEKTWMLWRAMVRKYAEKISIETIKKFLSAKGEVEPEQLEELETIQEVYDFFAKDYQWETAAAQSLQSLTEELGLSEEDIAERLVSRRISETMSWVSFVYQQWNNDDIEWLNGRLHAKRHSGKISEDIDIVKEVMRIANKETPQACIPVFDQETKYPREKMLVREFISNMEFDVAEKRLSETEDAFKSMVWEELRYQAVECYQREAQLYLEELRNAYKELGINIRLIITGFEQAEWIYPETDNIGSVFTELFSLSRKSIITPPDIIMLVSENVPKLYAHHLAVGSDFGAAYPVVCELQ